MLCYDPIKRLSAKQAVEHDWFLVEEVQNDIAQFQRQSQMNTHGGHPHAHAAKNGKENIYQLSK